jgi:hypothetical protein
MLACVSCSFAAAGCVQATGHGKKNWGHIWVGLQSTTYSASLVEKLAYFCSLPPVLLGGSLRRFRWARPTGSSWPWTWWRTGRRRRPGWGRSVRVAVRLVRRELPLLGDEVEVVVLVVVGVGGAHVQHLRGRWRTWPPASSWTPGRWCRRQYLCQQADGTACAPESATRSAVSQAACGSWTTQSGSARRRGANCKTWREKKRSSFCLRETIAQAPKFDVSQLLCKSTMSKIIYNDFKKCCLKLSYVGRLK